MNQVYRDFKKEADVLAVCGEIVLLESKLDSAIKEIETLQRGHVFKKYARARGELGSYVSGSVQQINNFIEKKNIKLKSTLTVTLGRLREKAEKVLRENIVVQTIPPLDVIRFKDVPVRYAYSSYGGREQRWGYGLHMRPFNEEGVSFTVANMPPHYVQSIHNHAVSEYCLIIGSKTEGIYYPEKKKEKIYSTKQSEIFRFSATTPHTLRNASQKYARNMTLKYPEALFDWRPAHNLHAAIIVRARIIKGELNVIDKNLTEKIYRIRDKLYDYEIVVTKLAKGAMIKGKFSEDHFIFVINGKLEVTHQKIRKMCRKNDLIVIDKNTDFFLTAQTMSRIYEVSY